MGTYGDELINLASALEDQSFEDLVRAEASGTRRRRLYVPPGSHQVAARSGTEIVIPPTLELWFVRGAQLIFVNDITLRIRGRVLAEPTQIFSLREVRDLAVEPGTSRIIFESEEQEEIHPEWFGAVPVLRGDLVGRSPLWRRNSRALQACLHAACRDRVRGETPLPPLTVVVREPIHFDTTLDVLPPPGMRGVLWLRGDDTATRSGTGIAALQRFARDANQAQDAEPEGPTAALRIHPAVSVENRGVALRVDVFDDARGPEAGRDVDAVVVITESEATPRSRHVFFENVGLVGGHEAVVMMVDQSTGALNSAPARTTRYGFRNCSVDLHFGRLSSARTAFSVDLSQDAMVTITGGVIFRVQESPSVRPDTATGILVRGSSVLVRGVSMHLAEGPRPTRAESGTSGAEPDGQDVWVEAGRRSQGSHLTLLHVDSQSWWLLGAKPVLDNTAVGAVSLVNVGANNVNWGPAAMNPVRPEIRSRDATQALALTEPPSVAWPGGALPLLLEGCSFRRYVTLPVGAHGRVANVGTVFQHPIGNKEWAWWLAPESIPRPERRAIPLRETRVGGRPAALIAAFRGPR